MHRQNVYSEVLLAVSNSEHEKMMKQQVKQQTQRMEVEKADKISKIIRKKKERHEMEVRRRESRIIDRPVVALKK
jgi:hypothetical protein